MATPDIKTSHRSSERGYFRVDVYEKATRMSRGLLGFIALRELLVQSALGASIFWVNTETSFADTEDLIIGWQTRRDLQRRGIVEVVEHDWE